MNNDSHFLDNYSKIQEEKGFYNRLKTKCPFRAKNEGVSKSSKRPQYKSKLATLVKYT